MFKKKIAGIMPLIVGVMIVGAFSFIFTACDDGNNLSTHTHEWGNWVITLEPTCSATGTRERVCLHDNLHKETETIPIDADAHLPNIETGLCKECGALTYDIGDIGPGGGTIFYRSETGFTMTDNNSTAHYLEAAPADMETMFAWASSSFSSHNLTGTETAIGTGRKNTAIILTVDYNAPAANACNDYENNGKTDWFLPSKDELNELYINKDIIGNLSGGYWNPPFGEPVLRTSYFSSSQAYIITEEWTYTEPWTLFIDDDGNGHWQYNVSKSNDLPTRAIRAF